MAVAGLRGTGDWGTDERPKNFREMILWMNPNGQAQLTALMSRMGKETTNDPEFSWWEETLSPVRLQANGAVLIAATTFTVDNGLNGATAEDLKAGDLLIIEEGAETTTYDYEMIQVTSVTSATVFEATRGVAGTTATAVTDNTYLTLVGSAYAEGTAKAGATSRNPTKFYNLTQIFKETYEVTGTAAQTHSRTGDPVKNDKKRKAFDHAARMEYAWFFGKRNETTGSNGKPLRYTGGALQLFGLKSPARAIIRGSAYSTNLNAFLDDVYDVFDYTGEGSTGGDERLAFCGNAALNAINKLAASTGTVNYKETVEFMGMKFKRFEMPQGTLMIKSHPLFNVHGRYSSGMVILDPPGIKYRPLRGRDTKTEDNIQTPGADTKEGQWITEAGTEWHHLETMKYIGNITHS